MQAEEICRSSDFWGLDHSVSLRVCCMVVFSFLFVAWMLRVSRDVDCEAVGGGLGWNEAMKGCDSWDVRVCSSFFQPRASWYPPDPWSSPSFFDTQWFEPWRFWEATSPNSCLKVGGRIHCILIFSVDSQFPNWLQFLLLLGRDRHILCELWLLRTLHAAFIHVVQLAGDVWSGSSSYNHAPRNRICLLYSLWRTAIISGSNRPESSHDAVIV